MAARATDEPLASPGGVQVIARIGHLLRELNTQPAGLSLTELATRLSLPRSTVHRLVVAMAAEGFLTDPIGAGQVRIGPELIRIANASRLDLRQRLAPIMRAAHAATGETVDCSVLEAGRPRVVDVLPTAHHLRVVAEVGATFPLHCSSKGKAILSVLTPDEVDELLPRTLERFTPQTTTTRTQLMIEIDQVRRTGLAFDQDEHVDGISAIAVGGRDPFGAVFALSVPVPSQRFRDERDVIVESLAQARRDLAQLFGHR